MAAVAKQPAAMTRHALEVGRPVGHHGRQHRRVDPPEQGVPHHGPILLGRAAGARLAARPLDDVVLERPGTPLADRPAAHGNARLVNRAGVAGHQRMPPGEPLALGNAPIRAGWWQPIDFAHRLGREPDAVRHPAGPVGVVAALAGPQVEQSARDVGERQVVGVLVAQLVQATAAAAIAEGLPLVAGHLLKLLALPERHRRGHTRMVAFSPARRKGRGSWPRMARLFPTLALLQHPVASTVYPIARTSRDRRAAYPGWRAAARPAVPTAR